MATVTLIGLMGAGKSKVGRRAADALRRDFVDTDALVEQAAGKPVRKVFDDDGEPAFRELERAAVAAAVGVDGRIVSVGGGAVLDDRNVATMRAAGPVVWLRATPGTLVARLRRSIARGDRPLLAGGDPHGTLAALLDDRRAAYDAAATVALDTDGLAVEQSAALLTDWIAEHT